MKKSLFYIFIIILLLSLFSCQQNNSPSDPSAPQPTDTPNWTNTITPTETNTIWVPSPLPTSTPTLTSTRTLTPTATPTSTPGTQMLYEFNDSSELNDFSTDNYGFSGIFYDTSVHNGAPGSLRAAAAMDVIYYYDNLKCTFPGETDLTNNTISVDIFAPAAVVQYDVTIWLNDASTFDTRIVGEFDAVGGWQTFEWDTSVNIPSGVDVSKILWVGIVINRDTGGDYTGNLYFDNINFNK